MFDFFKRLLRKGNESPDEDAIVEEYWQTDFSQRAKCRFRPELGEGYSSSIGDKSLRLEIGKANLFAWTEDPLYRYADFVVEADLSIDEGKGYSAAGILFRYGDSGNFYALMVSNRGHFRLDNVFNGTPIAIVPWTERPDSGDLRFPIRVICRGPRIVIIIGDVWACEAEDESHAEGGIAFAGQNYGEVNSAGFSLYAIGIESRPIEVETLFYRWNYYIRVEPEARIRLAESLAASQLKLAALVQVKKFWKARGAGTRDLMLASACALDLGLYDDASDYIEQLLSLEPGNPEALNAKANLLYFQGRYLELRAFLDAIRELGFESAILSNLAGHAEFELGNWETAAGKYLDAWKADQDTALFALNAARALDRSGRTDEAVRLYADAARIFYREGDSRDCADAVARLGELAPDNHEAEAIAAALAFQEGKTDEAEKSLSKLVKMGYEDAVVAYLYGLILAGKGNRKASIEYFRRAIELDPERALYRFRLAENLRLLGEDYYGELQKALDLDPTDGWAANLAGLYWAERAEPDKANEYLSIAETALPDEPAVAINRSEYLRLLGKSEEALAVLERFPDSGAAHNQAGNILCGLDRADEAATRYRKGLAIDPEDPSLVVNAAACAIELDRISEAEELIAKALELAPDARTYSLVGNLAALEGDRIRAEVSYRAGLELFPEDPSLMRGLAANYADRYLYPRAEEILDRLLEIEGESPSPRSIELRDRLRKETKDRIECSSCAREWWAPKSPDEEGKLLIYGEPPDDSPAGRCANCGKVYCVGCAKEKLDEAGRFACLNCGGSIKLSDAQLRFLVRESLSKAPKQGEKGSESL